jgi:hypothetical protein
MVTVGDTPPGVTVHARLPALTAAELVPAARQGLVQAGVAAEEADGLLDVISARAATGQTGAAWPRATLAAAEQRRWTWTGMTGRMGSGAARGAGPAGPGGRVHRRAGRRPGRGHGGGDRLEPGYLAAMTRDAANGPRARRRREGARSRPTHRRRVP